MLPAYIEFTTDPSAAVAAACTGYSRVVVLTDTNTRQFCLPLIQSKLPENHLVLEVSPGEEFKTLETCTHIWDALTTSEADRKTLLLILGGGVLGDLGGFCAATYKRGIAFILIPTTLLSQVDSSIGGKLGIDFRNLKNHIGVFKLPNRVIIYDGFLKTLPVAELRSGFAEVIKHVLISDPIGWSELIRTPWQELDWSSWIKHSVAFKAEVTQLDPEESGLRKILNAGHTLGHALESQRLEQGRKILHGEAVAFGLIAEAGIAMKAGILSIEAGLQIKEFILSVFGKLNIDGTQHSDLYNRMRQDKKNTNGVISGVLLEGIGKAKWDIPMTEEDIVTGINFYRGEAQM